MQVYYKNFRFQYKYIHIHIYTCVLAFRGCSFCCKKKQTSPPSSCRVWFLLIQQHEPFLSTQILECWPLGPWSLTLCSTFDEICIYIKEKQFKVLNYRCIDEVCISFILKKTKIKFLKLLKMNHIYYLIKWFFLTLSCQ